MTASALTKQSHLIRITPKLLDVCLHPLERQLLIHQTYVVGSILSIVCVQETESTYAIVECYHYDIAQDGQG